MSTPPNTPPAAKPVTPRDEMHTIRGSLRLGMCALLLLGVSSANIFGQTLGRIDAFDLQGPVGQRFDYLTIDDEDHQGTHSNSYRKRSADGFLLSGAWQVVCWSAKARYHGSHDPDFQSGSIVIVRQWLSMSR